MEKNIESKKLNKILLSLVITVKSYYQKIKDELILKTNLGIYTEEERNTFDLIRETQEYFNSYCDDYENSILVKLGLSSNRVSFEKVFYYDDKLLEKAKKTEFDDLSRFFIGNIVEREVYEKLAQKLEFAVTCDEKIPNIKLITKHGYLGLLNKLNKQEEFASNEMDKFLLEKKENGMVIAIDNSAGNMLTEKFKERELAIRYLQGENIDKLREEECKYEVRIYETEEDYKQGEPFQLNVFSDFEEAIQELKDTINLNHYFSGNIINQENGREEFCFYLDEENEKYCYIFKCDLEGHRGEIYKNQYLLVNNPNDLQTDFEIDLKGDFYFNCSCEIINPKLVQTISTIDELKQFCQIHNIEIPNEAIRKNGIVAGGEDGLVINNKLELLGWVEWVERFEEEI